MRSSTGPVSRLARSRLPAVALTIFLVTGPPPTMAIEEPVFRVVRTIDDVELRDYPPYTVAEVVIADAAERAGSEAFPILLGYITGRNTAERRMSMTAPVVQTAVVSTPNGTKTGVPFVQAATADGYVVQFVLPREVTEATAPRPTDPRVVVRDVAAHRYAVIRYAGFWSDGNDREHLARLRAVVEASGLRVVGEPLVARYDPPFKPWFLRRNEIWLPIASS